MKFGSAGHAPCSNAKSRIEPPSKAAERLFVKLVSPGRWKTDASQETKDGYTLWGMKPEVGRTVQHFDDMDKLISRVLVPKRR